MKPRNALAEVDISILKKEGDVLHFEYVDAFDREQKGMLIFWEGNYFAFQNLCPHWSIPLDTHGNEIWHSGSSSLICQTHGAAFDVESGICESGPCLGERLNKLSVEIQEDDPTRAIIFRAGLLFA